MFEIILFIIGIGFLLKGADFLIDGSSALAKRLRMPTIIIGLTVVAFGTSAPELVVNIFAAINKTGEISMGNIIGSNLANILLILGLSAIIIPLKVHRSLVWKEIPFSLIAAVILGFMASKRLINGNGSDIITRVDGIILLCFFFIFLFYISELFKAGKNKPKKEEFIIKKYSGWATAFMIIGGAVLLFLGGLWVVNGAIFIASKIGISKYLVSATIVAIGTSLPELFTSIMAIIKKESNLAIGNIIGSNIFNIFLILGVTAVISPIAVPLNIMFDVIFLMLAALLLFIFMFIGKKHELDSWQGVLFILMYFSYIVIIVTRG